MPQACCAVVNGAFHSKMRFWLQSIKNHVIIRAWRSAACLSRTQVRNAVGAGRERSVESSVWRGVAARSDRWTTSRSHRNAALQRKDVTNAEIVVSYWAVAVRGRTLFRQPCNWVFAATGRGGVAAGKRRSDEAAMNGRPQRWLRATACVWVYFWVKFVLPEFENALKSMTWHGKWSPSSAPKCYLDASRLLRFRLVFSLLACGLRWACGMCVSEVISRQGCYAPDGTQNPTD